MTLTARADAPAPADTAFVQFWNDVLAPKFIRVKHVLVGGLTQHSEAVFPSLDVRKGHDVQRGSSETGAASSQVFSAAQSLSIESNRLKKEVDSLRQCGLHRVSATVVPKAQSSFRGHRGDHKVVK